MGKKSKAKPVKPAAAKGISAKFTAVGRQLEGQERLRGLTKDDAPLDLSALSMRPTALLPAVRVPVQVAELAEDEGAMTKAVGALARTALEDSEGLRGVVGALIGIRQAYLVMYRRLIELVATHEVDGAPLSEPTQALLKDFLSQHANYVAGRPVNEHSVVQGFADTVLPRLVAAVDAHAEVDEKVELEEEEMAAKARRASRVEIGFRTTVQEDETSIIRGRSVVLVGWHEAVRWLLDTACDKATGAKAKVVRLADRATKAPSALVFGKNLWEGAGNTQPLTNGLLIKTCGLLSRASDLLVCDDLGATYTAGFVGRPAAANGGDGHRRFRQVCDLVGCAFLAGLRLDDTAMPDVSGSEYEQLRTFADVRQVGVTTSLDQPNYYSITVGGAPPIHVPAAELERYSPVLVAGQ